jgi:hypothetical protein
MFSLFVVLAAAQATAAQSASADDPIICTKENIGSEVGTRLQPKKVCMRKSDRDFIERSTRDTVQNYNNRGDDRMRAPTESPR